MASSIFYSLEGERQVSLREIVEAVEGTTYEMTKGVIMDDYGYPIYTAWLLNDNCDDSIGVDIRFDDWKSYDEPLKYYEIWFYGDEGFKFAKEIEEKLGLNFGLISASAHTDMTAWHDRTIGEIKWIKNRLLFEDIMKENNLTEHVLLPYDPSPHESIIKFLDKLEQYLSDDVMEHLENGDKFEEKDNNDENE